MNEYVFVCACEMGAIYIRKVSVGDVLQASCHSRGPVLLHGRNVDDLCELFGNQTDQV